LPLALIGAVAINHYASSERTREVARVAEAARSLAAAADRELLGQIETLSVLAATHTLQRADFTQFRQHAEDTRKATGAHVVLIDGAMRRLVDTRAAPGTAWPLAARGDTLEAAQAAPKAVVGNLEIGPWSGRPQFAIHMPVRIAEQTEYVLSLVPPETVLRDVLATHNRPQAWLASIMDGQGRVVARSVAHDRFYGQSASPDFVSRLIGKTAVLETVDLEGREAVTAFHTLGEAGGWKAIVWVPKAVLLEPLVQATNWIVALFAAALLTSLAAAFLTGYVINRSTRRTLVTAAALGRGEPLPGPEPSIVAEAEVIDSALKAASVSITEREKAVRNSEAHLRVLMQELSHRSMNLLTVVHAMARQTGRTATSFDTYRQDFEARVAGLARSHELLVARDWAAVSLRDLVRAHVAPVAESGQIDLAGNDVELTPTAVQNIGMGLHELATNAAKYGALSVPAGRVSVRWQIETSASGASGPALLRLDWTERQGPPVRPPARQGFGRTVLERVVPEALDGEARLDWAAEGLTWRLDVPLRSAVAAE